MPNVQASNMDYDIHVIGSSTGSCPQDTATQPLRDLSAASADSTSVSNASRSSMNRWQRLNPEKARPAHHERLPGVTGSKWAPTAFSQVLKNKEDAAVAYGKVERFVAYLCISPQL